MPLHRQLLQIAWPAFMAACAMEVLVFALVDPQDLYWSGQALALSRQAVYTAGFFAFWSIGAAACAMTAMLGRAETPGRNEPGRI